jgi:hypothetical protein
VPAGNIIGPVTVVALIACSKSKAEEPAPAGELYTGQLFRAARAWAQEHADQWFVLSAKYGLVHPNIWIAPYERTLNDMPEAERRSWVVRVFFQIRQRRDIGVFPDPDDQEAIVVLLAGEHYRRYLVDDLRAAGYGVIEPLAGMGYGQQVAWLKANTEEES